MAAAGKIRRHPKVLQTIVSWSRPESHSLDLIVVVVAHWLELKEQERVREGGHSATDALWSRRSRGQVCRRGWNGKLGRRTKRASNDSLRAWTYSSRMRSDFWHKIVVAVVWFDELDDSYSEGADSED